MYKNQPCCNQRHSLFQSLVSDVSKTEIHSFIMNPLVVLSAVFAVASAAPSGTLLAGHPAVGYAHAGAVRAAGPAVPIPQALPGNVPAPAPYTSEHVAAPATKVAHQAPIQVTKSTQLGSAQFVSGYAAQIHKPPTPHLPIAVPTVLKGTQQINPAIVKKVDEIHTVNQPIPVEKPYNVPYDVPVPVEKIVEVPVEVRVAKPVPVGVPTPVQGQPIVRHHQTAPIVKNTHTNIVSQPAVAVGYATHGYAAAAAPAVAAHGYAAGIPAVAAHGYAAAPLAAAGIPAVAAHGYATAPVAAIAH